MTFKSIMITGSAVMAMAITASAAVSPIRRNDVKTGEYKSEFKSVSVAKPASRIVEEETWKPFGTGQLRGNLMDPWYIVPDYPQWNVQIMESEQTPNRFKVINPYHDFPYDFGGGKPTKDCYMIVDASDPTCCFIECSETHVLLGYLNGTKVLAQMAVWSIADDVYNNGSDWDGDEADIRGILENGCVTFPPGSILATLVSDSNPDWNTVWSPVNNDGMFRLRLPNAPHLDLDLGFTGKDGNDLFYDVRMEKDVDYVLAALVPGDFDEKSVAGIIDGSIPSTKVEADGTISFPYTADGQFTLVAVPFHDGKAFKAFHLTKTLQFDESEWKKCGKCLFSEGILSSNEMRAVGFALDFEEYEVEVEENVATPGLIRLVNPYGLAYSYANESNYDTSNNYYMEIDATHHEWVYIKKMESIGLDLGYGRMTIQSRADREIQKGFDKFSVNKKLFGLHADDTITIPEDAMLLNFPLVNPEAWYYANENGKTKITFQPGQIQGGVSGVGEIADDANAPEEWFTIDGLRLESKPAQSGLYLRRQGKSTIKVVL